MLILSKAGLVSHAFAVEPLTQVEIIRALSREQAAQALPVILSGTVVYKGWRNLVLHDGKSAVFVDFHHAQAQGVWKGPIPNLNHLQPGTGVEIEGVTDPGGFSPMVLATKFGRTGPRPIPPPMRPTIEELLSSSHDTQWVEVEGVVRKLESPPRPTAMPDAAGGRASLPGAFAGSAAPLPK